MFSANLKVNKILRNYIEDVYVRACLRRIDDWPGDEAFLTEVLAEFEASGDAMRYVNAQGQIAWKTTPKLRDHLHDMRLDAEADLALGET